MNKHKVTTNRKTSNCEIERTSDTGSTGSNINNLRRCASSHSAKNSRAGRVSFHGDRTRYGDVRNSNQRSSARSLECVSLIRKNHQSEISVAQTQTDIIRWASGFLVPHKGIHVAGRNQNFAPSNFNCKPSAQVGNWCIQSEFSTEREHSILRKIHRCACRTDRQCQIHSTGVVGLQTDRASKVESRNTNNVSRAAQIQSVCSVAENREAEAAVLQRHALACGAGEEVDVGQRKVSITVFST